MFIIMKILEIYTDGSLRKRNNITKAAFSIYFPNQEYDHLCEEVIEFDIHYTELIAIKRALKIIINDINIYDKIIFYTDSNHCIRKIKKWYSFYKNDKVEEIKTKKGKEIKNKKILMEIYEIINDNMDKFQFEFVKAHTNQKDEKSINNKIVDKLAKSKTKIKKIEKTK